MGTLKPCPFCGDTYIKVYSHNGYYTVGCNSLSCVCLHTHAKPFETEEKAIEAWNGRVEMSDPIDRQAAINTAKNLYAKCTTENITDYRDLMVESLKVLPPAQPELNKEILVDLVKLMYGDEIKVTVNDTTNTLSKRIIFGKNKAPQSER